jgi:hypothetical protein
MAANVGADQDRYLMSDTQLPMRAYAVGTRWSSAGCDGTRPMQSDRHRNSLDVIQQNCDRWRSMTMIGSQSRSPQRCRDTLLQAANGTPRVKSP